MARGGSDQTIILKVYGDWIDELVKEPGTATPDGNIVADMVEAEHEGNALINLDSIGIGASPFDILERARVTCLWYQRRVSAFGSP